MALSEIYGPDKVARAIEDAFEFAAFSSDYIANILEQRERLTLQPGPLHLTTACAFRATFSYSIAMTNAF
jgi:hypothetical protein